MRSENSRDVLIIGGGVTGLTLALSLHEAGIPCCVYEAAPELKWLGVGINLLPHAVRELTELGLAERLERDAVLTREMCFYNRFGQFVYKEPRGRYAGLRLAAVFDSPRRSAPGAGRGGARAILRLVHERTGDKPFGRVEDVVSEEELAALMEKYKRIAGFEREALKSRPSLVS